MTTATLTAFFGWMTLVNLGVYLLAVAALFLWRDGVMRLHGGIFDIPEERLRGLWYAWLGNYKIVILALNLAPYIALRILS